MLAKIHYKHGGIIYMQVPDILQNERVIRLAIQQRPASIFDFAADMNSNFDNYQTFENKGTKHIFGEPALILKEI